VWPRRFCPGARGGDAAWRLRELETIVEAASEAIVGTRLDGTITSWNPAAARLFGYLADEAAGRSIELLEPEELVGESRGLLERLREGDGVSAVETVRRRKDGSRVDVVLTISPIRDDEGSWLGAVMLAREVDDGHRHLFDRHPAPMWLYDPRTLRFLAVNEAAVSACGYSREEVLGMRIGDFLHADEEAPLSDQLDGAGGGGHVRQGLWKLQVKGGVVRDVQTWAATIELAGRPARLVLAEDVTEELRVERELRRAQTLATVGRLTSGIAHDFNNVLLVIHGYNGRLLNRLHDPELLASVHEIDVAAQRAADLTRQLLEFARCPVARPERTDLNTVVEDAFALLEPVLGSGIAIEIRLDPALQPVLLDRSQLTQAILNLALNARDAMHGTGTLSVRTARVDLDGACASEHEAVAPGRWALLQVGDSGEGMDDETRGRIFEPFFTTKSEGTGLGLATIQEFVCQSGGHVAVRSAQGQGTSFELYFPALDESMGAAGGSAS
jgi:PAS domain S-box-containing protein